MRRKGEKRPKGRCSIRDLALYVGLSTCTVSKVLNGKAGSKISAETQERVLKAAKELDYVPNVNAKRLFSKRSGVIGLLVPSRPLASGNVFGDAHFVNILSGLEPKLEEEGYRLMLLFRNEERNRDERYLPLFRDGSIDGLLIWGAASDCEYYRELEEARVPYLFISSFPAGTEPESINLVGCDYARTAGEVARILLDSGAKHILYLAGPENGSASLQMRRGVETALDASGVEYVVRFSDYTPAGARNALVAGEFDALLAVNRNMAAGALEAAGEEIGKIGILDCEDARPPFPCEIASARVDDHAIGRCAIEGLIELIEKKRERIFHILPGEVTK